ncbi:conserved hypothetical protein, secreted [Candidatus Magnetomorum sp. HK-1]|nr:conserved hypothetical protein, secreted [Candidatus Magnetomorum sp. HK-1]
MKQKNMLITIIFLSVIIISNVAESQDIASLVSYSHTENQPDNNQSIEVEWSKSASEGTYYYAAFSKDNTFEFSDEDYEYDPSEPEEVPDHVILPVSKLSHAINESSQTFTTDGTYYFNIVIDEDGDYGQTKSIGPFIIDTSEPSPVNIEGVTSTTNNSIELTVEPADADQICTLLNTTNHETCNWQAVPESRTLISPTLSSGNNQIHILFKDMAGNMNQASHVVECNLSENEQVVNRRAVCVPALTHWGRILFFIVLLGYSFLSIHKKKNVCEHKYIY